MSKDFDNYVNELIDEKVYPKGLPKESLVELCTALIEEGIVIDSIFWSGIGGAPYTASIIGTCFDNDEDWEGMFEATFTYEMNGLSDIVYVLEDVEVFEADLL